MICVEILSHCTTFLSALNHSLLIEVFDLCYLPCYDEQAINSLRNAVDFMNWGYVEIFEKDLKPVHHFLTHYPEDIINFGPVRYLKTIR